MHDPLGISRGFAIERLTGGGVEHVVVQQPLRRVLAAIDRSIDDVVNSQWAKREVLGYYKLQRFVERRSEVIELERQWNPTGRRR
jgi:hypothetical protein